MEAQCADRKAHMPAHKEKDVQRHLEEVRQVALLRKGLPVPKAIPISRDHMQQLEQAVAAFHKDPKSLAGGPLAPLAGAKIVKLVHFVRHGEAEHNLASTRGGISCQCPDGPCPYIDPALLDPRLTKTGREQAAAIQPEAVKCNAKTVVVSSLRRTLETATIAMAACDQSKLHFIAKDECREQIGGRHICDKRCAVSEQRKLFPHVDFSGVATEEDAMWTDQREGREKMAKRGDGFLAWLSGLPADDVAVFTHSSILLTLMNLCMECSTETLKQWYTTGEMRSVALGFF